MVYAVGVVNNRQDLLPNVTLGFDIRDDCFDEDTALWAALSLINKDQCTSTNPSNIGFPNKLVGFVGPITSTMNVVVGAMCDLLEIPSISYGATSDELSDKSRFEFFSRAVPPDSHQSEALADLLQYFNWEYVSLVYFANTYGIQASHAFQNFARERGICIAVSAPVRSSQTERELAELADTLFRSKKAQVVVMFVGSPTANAIIATLRDRYPDFASKVIWIGSDYWTYTMSPKTDDILPIGGIFVNFFLPAPRDFKNYFTELSLEEANNNPWIEMYFGQNNMSSSIGDYDLTGVGGLAAAVIDSVLAFAYALDSMLEETCSELNFVSCYSKVNFTGRELLGFIRSTNFEGTRGLFKLDANGDLSGKYVLKNLQIVNGEPSLVDIAVWDALNTSQKLTIHPELILWSNGTNTVPGSSCREECPDGYIIIPLEEKCCWGCRKCENNEIVVNHVCHTCDYMEWPNENFTRCDKISPTLLYFGHPVLIVIILFSALGVLLCCLTTIGLIKYHNHRQVKASSRELSALNIFGLLMGFIVVFIMLLEPTAMTCALVHTMISLCLTLIYAPTLLKVSRIYRIFDAGKKSTRRPKGTGPKEQLIFATILIIIQVMFYLSSSSIKFEADFCLFIYLFFVCFEMLSPCGNKYIVCEWI